jgi:serine protease Do
MQDRHEGHIQLPRTIIVLAMLSFTVVPAAAQELSPNQIYAQAAPAVVLIIGHGPGVKGSGGTGSIIDANGLVLTNAHVVVEETSQQPYPQLSVYLKPDRVTGNQEKDLSRRVAAHMVAFDRGLDVALLKMDSPVAGAVLQLGDPALVRIGDRMVAIGHPEQGGLWTLTTGVISAEFENFQKIPGKDVFQTEASFNRGNSGGPLLDAYGHQVGVNTSIARKAADGLAITSINFSLKSSVVREWLGRQGVQVAYADMKAVPPIVSVPSVQTPTVPRVTSAPPTSNGTPSKPQAPDVASPPRVEGQAIPPAAAPTAPSKPERSAPETHVPPPPRPYDLDRLVQGLKATEKDLEGLMDEMRSKTRPKD